MLLVDKGSGKWISSLVVAIAILTFDLFSFIDTKSLITILRLSKQPVPKQQVISKDNGLSQADKLLVGLERVRQAGETVIANGNKQDRLVRATSYNEVIGSASKNQQDQLNNNKSSNSTAVAKTANVSLHKALRGLQNPKLMGGDVLIKTGSAGSGGRLIKFARSALVSSVSLWPGGVIFYELDPSVDQLTDQIWQVMQLFHDSTCLRFVMRGNNQPDYLKITALRGCFSYIGRIGGEQALSLGEGCESNGVIAHELLHAIGFYHHQNRSDRDEFLEILWENIARGKENQFIKMAPHENLLLNEFDYNSVMLYGPRTFGKTIDKVTMKPKREGVNLLEVMEKKGPSLMDIDSVNKLYKCKSDVKT